MRNIATKGQALRVNRGRSEALFRKKAYRKGDKTCPGYAQHPESSCLREPPAFTSERGSPGRRKSLVLGILGSLGKAFRVDSEGVMDAVTALSGSGPAFVSIFIEALCDGAVKMGLPRKLATDLAAQTVLGTSKMIQEERRASCRDKGHGHVARGNHGKRDSFA